MVICIIDGAKNSNAYKQVHVVDFSGVGYVNYLVKELFYTMNVKSMVFKN